MSKNFDLVLLRVGYSTFAMPKAAAFQFLEMCAGNDIYEWNTSWKAGGSEEHASLLSSEKMPSITLLGPAQFHQAKENYAVHMENERAAKANK